MNLVVPVIITVVGCVVLCLPNVVVVLWVRKKNARTRTAGVAIPVTPRSQQNDVSNQPENVNNYEDLQFTATRGSMNSPPPVYVQISELSTESNSRNCYEYVNNWMAER